MFQAYPNRLEKELLNKAKRTYLKINPEETNATVTKVVNSALEFYSKHGRKLLK